MLVGQQFGPFTIDKELGSGAMGTVYSGRYTKTGQIMAIKIMSPGIGATNAAAADRFEREITILKQLNHSNIVRFYGAGKQQKMRYFAMEYIEGESLDKVMGRRGRMTWEEVAELGKQLCAALQHAHEKGIIHRDLKPSNIMMLPDGTLKLTDFGIAKDTDLDALTATNCTVGTAAYMSPEQCKGQSDLTNKSDLYSMGILFYELVTGRKPFQANNAMDMFVQHVQGACERPARIVLDLPVWMDTLICQLLEKKPEHRPLDANMVANTLGSIQEKIESQQSAGVETVRRRLIDRTAGQKRLEEEDKDAARVLMTGKGKAKRKQVKKPFYQKVWVQAIGLTFALGIVGTLLYLVFRPPTISADKLYQQAKAVMDSGNVDKQDKAIESDGAIRKYLRTYGSQKDEQTRQVRGWSDQIEDRQCQQLLDNYLQKERKSPIKMEAQSDTEKWAFAAVKAEDEGRLTPAKENWQKVEGEGVEKWQRTARKHLAELNAALQADEKFKKAYERLRISGIAPSFADPHEKTAFLAWRAKYGKIEDASRAKALLSALKEETAKEAGPRKRWYLYTAEKSKSSGDVADSVNREKLIDEKLEEADKQRASNAKDALLICRDIVELYKNDKQLQPKVKTAEERHKEIAKDINFPDL